MRIAVGLAVLILQQSLGCDQTPTPKEHHAPPIHRFVSVTVPPSPGMALDTMTGQLCRTWDWAYTAKPDASDLNTAPTCLSLYELTAAREQYDSIKPGGK
jgi:hypothetical protein